MKRVVSVVLVLVMVLSMTTTAFAGFSGTLRDENGNIVEQTTISDIASEESSKGYSGTADNNSGITAKEDVTPAKPQQSATSNSVIKSFSDVSAKHWAYSAVMNMVKKGMLEGTTKPVNGVGTFSPDKTMNRAEFVTVVVRYLYADEVSQQPKGDYWYSPYYNVAVDNGLIKTNEFSEASMKQPMNRQEMSMVVVRAMQAAGEDAPEMIDKDRIPDYASVGTYYKNYVRQAYQAGMIAGVDKAGTFNPLGTLTRAQAATVLNRLVDASTRVDIKDVIIEEEAAAGSISWDLISTKYCKTSYKMGDEFGLPEYLLIYDHPFYGSYAIDMRTGDRYFVPEKDGKYTLANSDLNKMKSVSSEPQTFYEKGIHSKPKVGDTVIKTNGSTVVLTASLIGDNYCTDLVVGYGQGADIVTGTTVNGYTIKEGQLYNKDGHSYTISDYTGECYVSDVWSAIMEHTAPSGKGSYDGEVRNVYWMWDADAWHPENGTGDWVFQ
ncbi:MAG: S-layer homology domain-containing protein [Clostridiales bacterium]|nr:S-layer homology domain-containing protein [Clostridiales bacterium]